MIMHQPTASWLQRYYFMRFAFSAVWVASAFTIARVSMPVAALMFIAYPAWDALANYIDAKQSGGLAQNRPQTFNLIVSALTTIAAAIALSSGAGIVLDVFGVWAALAGAFQFVTGLHRQKTQGAQWAIILSGAQSVIAGVFFVKMAQNATVTSITLFAPYAALGAIYFLISGILLAVAERRRNAV